MIVDPAHASRETADNGGEMVFLSEAGGLTQFGAYTDRLMPGATSSRRHWHSCEDEFAYILSGNPTLVDDHGAQDLAPGDAVCWRHGEPNGHHLHNRTDQPVSSLIIGSRAALDQCHYPDDGQTQVNTDTEWSMLDSSGKALRGGALPAHLMNLPPRWGTPFDGTSLPRIIRKGSIKGESGSGYPEGFNNLGDYMAYPLSDEGGLTQFGAFTEHLMPASQSSQRHWHEEEDEFLYVLEGEVTVVEDDGEHVLTPGMAACWPKGVANAHCLRNRSASPVFYLVAGTRLPDDTCHYPDIDLHYSRRGGVRIMSHKDGTPYPGWPKGAPK
jgi:uncharacterized cupin superfamily protein